MMTFQDALQFTPQGVFEPTVTLQGYLVVGFQFSYLVERLEDESRAERAPAILLAEARLADLLGDAGCPMRVGSSVIYAGTAEIMGELFRTGMGQFPIGLIARRVTFHGEEERYQLELPPEFPSPSDLISPPA